MQAALAAALEETHRVLRGVPRVRVAYSGGLDSTVLLHALAARGDLPLDAVHINHQLHADAGDWQRHCASQCARLGVVLHTERVAVTAGSQGPEAAAREARYACFERLLGDGEVLLLAQHLDDQAETLLLRLLRGAGPEGLAAMPRQRALGRGTLLRPLLDVPRAALRDYAAACDLTWMDDPSNADTRFDRNYLRREVLPLLEQRWPAYRRSFARAAGLLARQRERDDTPRLPARCSAVGDPGFSLAALPAEPGAAALAVRRWLRDMGLAMPSAAQLNGFIAQLARGDRARLQTRQWVLERYRDAVYAYRPGSLATATAIDLDVGAVQVVEGVGEVELRRAANSDALPDGPYCLRFRRGGERLAQADGGHLRLKTLFQSLGIPRWWRDRLPLLYRGEELLWVGPYRRAALPAAAALSLHWTPDLLAD